jgi:hypothetical protein
MDEPFDTKVAVVVLEDLPVWQKANAAAFLLSGIAGSTPVSSVRLPSTGPGTDISRC